MNARAVTRRQALAGAALAGAGGLLAKAPAVARAAEPLAGEADVIVIGAGLGGLTAADALRAAGRNVIVLEARTRVGGRNYDLPLLPGGVLEMGGQWTGPGQSQVRALARTLGIETFPTYEAGENIYYAGGSLKRYAGSTPPLSQEALGELLALITQADGLAAEVNATQPWKASRAAEFDRQTISSWLSAQTASTDAAQLIEQAMRGVYGEEPSQVSLLDLLAQITGVGGSIETLTGSAQSIRFVGGPQQMSERLAAQLASRVVLSARAIEVITEAGSSRVLTTAGLYAAPIVLVAVPKAVTTRIRFVPELPPDYAQYFTRQPSGATVKTQVVYGRPFWRSEGLSGIVVSEAGPIDLVYDNSPPEANPGVLVCFAEGNFGRYLFRLSATARRRAVLTALEGFFGAAAAKPVRYEEAIWAAQPFTLGAYGSFNPPGVLTSVGQAVNGPVGSLYFAGADYSAAWPGYMEGAIRSGRAAAKAILKR